MLFLLAFGVSMVTALHSHPHPHPHAHSHIEPYNYGGRNQRIIKLHSSPFKHHPHHKHIRPGPLGPHVHYHDSHDHHYEYIQPNSYPPIPPFVNSPHGTPPLKYSSRPSYHHYKNPSFGGVYKPNTFRSPVIKDHFRSPPVPTTVVKPSFEYLPSPKPSLNHIINSDDDRGPIHEIPAPNLGPKPDHAEESNYFSTSHREPTFSSLVKDVPVISFEKKPSYEVVESNDKVIQNPDGSKTLFAPDPDPSIPAPKIPPTFDPHSIPSKPGNDNDNNFPTGQEYQILEATPNVHDPIPNLSGQELYDLMHSFPNDEYTVIQTSNIPNNQNVPSIPQMPHVLTVLGSQIPYQGIPQVIPQPGFIQHTSHSHSEVENDGVVHNTAINHGDNNQYHDFNQPQYQSFNYDERNHNAGAVPIDNYNNHFMYEPEASESESQGSVVKQTGNVDIKQKPKQTLPSDLTNLIPDDDDDMEGQDKSPIFKLETDPEIPFYSSLPSKQAAEAFATLQAAGSIATKITKMRGDQDPDKEGESGLVNFGLPAAELTKPHQVHNHAPASPLFDYDQEEQPKKTEEKTVEVQKSVPIFEASYKATSLAGEGSQNDEEILANLDAGQGAASEKFGKRIRPK